MRTQPAPPGREETKSAPSRHASEATYDGRSASILGMDDRRVAELARRQAGVVSSAQLRACGLGTSGVRHRARSSRLFRIRRSAYSLSPRWDFRAELWAALLVTQPDAGAISHWSAAAVHGMAKSYAPPVHLTLPGTGGRSLAGVVVHRARKLAPEDVMDVDGLRVTTPARTVLDIAGRADDEAVRRLIREGEYLRLLPAGAMLGIADAHPRHPGAACVRRANPSTAVADLGQTPLEDELQALLLTLPLPPPDGQVALRGASGRPYRVDFGWRAFRLAAEADGRSAHERLSSVDSDRFRDNDLAAIGWQTLRFTRARIVADRAETSRQVIATAMRRGWSPAVGQADVRP